MEIGCGLEPMFLHITGFTAYTLVEPSPQFMKNAKRLAPTRSNICFIQDYLENAYDELSAMPVHDFIIISSVLHEVPDPKKFLKVLFKLSGASTVIHINVPNVLSFHRLLGMEAGITKSVYEKSEDEIRFYRYTQFTKSSLVRMIEDAGFEIISSGTYFIKPFSNAQMEHLLKTGIIDEKIIRGLENMATYLPEMGCEIYVDIRKAKSTNQ